MKINKIRAISNIQKIAPGFILFVILMTSAALMSILSFNQTQEKIQRISVQFQPQMLNAMQLTSQLYHSLSFLESYVIKHDEESLKAYTNKIADIDQTLNNLTLLALNDTQTSDYDRLDIIRQLISNIKECNQRLLEVSLDQNQNFPAIGKASGSLEPLGEKIFQQINDLLSLAEQNNQSELHYNLSNLRYVWNMTVSEKRYFLAYRDNHSLDRIKMYIVGLAQAESTIDRNTSILDQEQTEVFQDLSDDISHYLPLLNEVIELHSGANWRLDSIIMEEEVNPTLHKLSIQLNHLVKEKQSRIEDIYTQMSRQINFVTTAIGATVTLASIIVMYLLLNKFRIRRLELKIKGHKKNELHLWRQANFDYLTSLATRQFFHEQLESIINLDTNQFSLLFIDLDGFKRVNDNISHAAGDEVLIETASRLQKSVRTNDLVARLGGDEFVILLDNLNDLNTVNAITNKVCKAISRDFFFEQHRISISCSIGIVMSDESHRATEQYSATAIANQLISNADQAMYQTKKNGKNGFSYNNPLQAVS